jgi:hypothetical protein
MSEPAVALDLAFVLEISFCVDFPVKMQESTKVKYILDSPYQRYTHKQSENARADLLAADN